MDGYMDDYKDDYIYSPLVSTNIPQGFDPLYLIRMMDPIIECLEEGTLSTTALTAYLLGKGYDEIAANSTVECWERMGLFPPFG